MSEIIDVNKKNWHDFSFEKLILDDNIDIFLTDNKNSIYHIRCENCIGILSLGLWNEGIIEQMKSIQI